MKVLLIAIATLLTGCVQPGPTPANDQQLRLIENWWPQYYQQCLENIVRNLNKFKVAGISTTEEREAYCSCWTNSFVSLIKNDVTLMYNNDGAVARQYAENQCLKQR